MQAMPANKNRCVGAYGSTCGEPIPESKGVTRFTWTTGPLGVSLRHRFVDSVTTDRVRAAARRRVVDPVPAALLTLHESELRCDRTTSIFRPRYDFGDKVEVYAGVNNVLDTDPPIVARLRRLR